MSNSTSGTINLSQSLNEMDMFIKGLDRLNKKVNGIFNNANKKIKRSRKEITSYFKTLNNELTDFSRNSEKSFDSLTTSAENAFDSMTKSAERSFGRIRFLLNNLNSKSNVSLHASGGGRVKGEEQESDSSWKNWLEIGAAVVTIGGIFGSRYWTNIGKIIGWVIKWGKKLGPLMGTIFRGIGTGLGKLGPMLKGMVPNFSWIAKAASSVKGSIATKSRSIGTWLGNVGQTLKGMKMPRFPKLVNLAKEIKGSMVKAASGITTWARNAGKGVSTWMGVVGNNIGNVTKRLGPVLSTVTTKIRNMGSGIGAGLRAVSKRIKGGKAGKIIGGLALGGALLGGGLLSSKSNASDQYPSGDQGNPNAQAQGAPEEQDSGGFLSDALSFGGSLLTLPGVSTGLRFLGAGLRVARLATPVGWGLLAAEALLTSDFVTDKISSWWNGSGDKNTELARAADAGLPRVSPGVMANTSKNVTYNFNNHQSYTITVAEEATAQSVKTIPAAIEKTNKASEKAMMNYLGALT